MAARKENNKPTKRERNTGRAVTTRPQNDKPFRTFLDAIPQDLLYGACMSQPDTSRLRLLGEYMRCNGGPKPALLVTMCKKAGVSMQEVANLMKDTAIAEGTVRMMLHLPQVMEDVGEDAKTKKRTCSACKGTGRIRLKDEDGNETEDTEMCLNCEGTGTVREIGDKHARDLMFESGGLTNVKVPLISQNFDMRSTSGLKEVMVQTADLLEPEKR